MSDLFFCILGFIVGGLGLLIIIVEMRSFIKCRTKVNGVITSINKKSRFWRGRTITDYNPQFQYTYEGQDYDAIAPFSSTNKDKYIPGTYYDIFINPNNPEQYRFKNESGLVIAGIILLIVGALFALLYFM